MAHTKLGSVTVIDGKPYVLAEAGVREPICWCGDWKHAHKDGTGVCATCGHMSEPAGGCTEFRFAGTEIRRFDPNLPKKLLAEQG